MIAIHQNRGSFTDEWIEYCNSKNIRVKIVDCYRTDILDQLKDCDALMWHFHHASSKDILLAKQLLYAIEQSGKPVFPDFKTMWHFDDKIGQKYLLEGMGAPLVPSYVFYSKSEAVNWVATNSFPKVFKLRGGASSQNVKLIKSKDEANRYIKKAFGRGFSQYDAWGNIKERNRKFRIGKASLVEVLKGYVRLFKTTDFAKIRGREKGYVYFQDFIPNNDHDIRVIVIGDKAFAIKRLVRKNDFRASGSGSILFERELFDENTIRLSFEYAAKLKSQCVAFDFVYSDGNPLIVEISYGFLAKAYQPCPGYWDTDLNFHEGKFNPCNWMVDLVLDKAGK